MIGVLAEPHEPRRVEKAVEMLVADLEIPHRATLRSLMIEPRAAMPPSIVTIVPVMYAARGDARKTIRSATSSALAGRPAGYLARNSSQRLSSPYQSSARRLLIFTMRSVSTGPGFTPTTRT